MKVLLFVGAGASIELGVPAMYGLAEEFHHHVQQWDVAPEMTTSLLGEQKDIERLIESLDQLVGTHTILKETCQAQPDPKLVETLRAEVEWFVQHAAERVATPDAELMWGPLLRCCSTTEITIVTTNYDRAIELAANSQSVELDDGFGSFAHNETAPWMGFGLKPSSEMTLVKLHGSTDWYAVEGDQRPIKLRHPMPLFGRATLGLAHGEVLASALVLPSREKLLQRSPYRRLSQAFLNAADQCEMAVFVGSSLRDVDVRNALEEILRRVPVFIVSPSGDSHGFEGVVVVEQHASTFLTSTLPNALKADSASAALRLAKPDHEGVLDILKRALDPAGRRADRCLAIDQLDAQEITLDSTMLHALLHDENPDVARYSLALISRSPDCDKLVEEAEGLAWSNDAAFSEDLRLLKLMTRAGSSALQPTQTGTA
jgi:hypothetical protein